MNIPETIKKAHGQAIEAAQKAYAPYSQFQVGALIKFVGQDQPIKGCNVENASYPAGLCAERVALFSSVVQFGKKEIEWVIIVTKASKPTPPCGLCLQVMSEFSTQDFPVYLANHQRILQSLSFRELLPHPFREENL